MVGRASGFLEEERRREGVLVSGPALMLPGWRRVGDRAAFVLRSAE